MDSALAISTSLLVGDGQAAGRAVRVDRHAEAGEQPGGRRVHRARGRSGRSRGQRLAAHRDVLGHGEVGEQRRLLVDDRDAGGLARRPGWPARPSAPSSSSVPVSGPVHAGEHLHDGGLAGAVLADERVRLAGVQREATPCTAATAPNDLVTSRTSEQRRRVQASHGPPRASAMKCFKEVAQEGRWPRSHAVKAGQVTPETPARHRQRDCCRSCDVESASTFHRADVAVGRTQARRTHVRQGRRRARPASRWARSPTCSTTPSVVSTGTRERVQAAIDELGFVRNESARQLRAGSSRTLAYVVLDAAQPVLPRRRAGRRGRRRGRRAAAVHLQQRRGPPSARRPTWTCSSSSGSQGMLITPVDPRRPPAGRARPPRHPGGHRRPGRADRSTARSPSTTSSAATRRRRTCSSRGTAGSPSSAARAAIGQVATASPGAADGPIAGPAPTPLTVLQTDSAQRRRGPLGRRAARRPAGRAPADRRVLRQRPARARPAAADDPARAAGARGRWPSSATTTSSSPRRPRCR